MADEKISAVKAYLQKIRLYDTHINNEVAEMSRLKDMVTNITPTLKDDVVSGSGSKDKLGDTVAKIVDLPRSLPTTPLPSARQIGSTLTHLLLSTVIP